MNPTTFAVTVDKDEDTDSWVASLTLITAGELTLVRAVDVFFAAAGAADASVTLGSGLTARTV